MATTETTRQPFSVTELTLDVSAGMPQQQAGTVGCSLFVPDELPERPVVVVGVPGGSYNRHYFDLQPPGRAEFSQARYFAERGLVFAAIDYLGGGGSTIPADYDELSMPAFAQVSHAAVAQLRVGLSAGTWGWSALDDALFIGFGFSFGCAIVLLQQAKYADYGGVIMSGWSPLGADAPVASGDVGPPEVSADGVYQGASRRTEMWRAFYLPGTDEQLIRYDEERVRTPVSRTAVWEVMDPFLMRPFARQIACPVLMGFADEDLVMRPCDQAAAFEQSSDVTVVVIPNARHLINFLDSRKVLWNRSIAWIRGVADGWGAEG
jgi:alpha-beta hydrolase superfamily lysophospholipase